MNRFPIGMMLLAALIAPAVQAEAQTIVQKHGQLRVQGNRIVDGGWTPSQIKPSGILVRKELRAKAPVLEKKETE